MFKEKQDGCIKVVLQPGRFEATGGGYLAGVSNDRDTSRTSADTDQPERDGDEGIDITSGEPNTFEPEEDPESAGG